MTYLFHGSGALGMLNRISSIRKNFEPGSVIEFSSKTSDFTAVKLTLESTPLFMEKRLFILEDFQNINLENLHPDENTTIILKFPKALVSSAVLLKNAAKLKVQVADFPEEKETSMFPYLDALAEKNPKALSELQSHLDEWGGQYVLTMICYMLRRMVLPPAKTLPSFVSKKLELQKKNFPPGRLRAFYRRVLETDFKIKNGLLDEKTGLFSLSEQFLH